MPIPSPLTALCPAGALSSSPLAFHSRTLVPQSPLDNLKGREWILSLPLTLPWPRHLRFVRLIRAFWLCLGHLVLVVTSSAPTGFLSNPQPHPAWALRMPGPMG